MVFSDRLRHSPVVFEAVPPLRRASKAALRGFVARIRDVAPRVDALNLPEVLDENYAGQPLYRHMDPRQIVSLLEVDREIIVNKVVVHLKGAAGFDAWLKETLGLGIRNVVLVGGQSARPQIYPGPSVLEATARARSAAPDVAVGNVAIPGRPDETSRLLAKTRAGCQFFTTQVLFDAEPATEMLRAYADACASSGEDLEPRPFLLSFAPVSDALDVEFLEWLGAVFPSRVRETIVERSLDVAEDIFTRVRDAATVPVGVNIEEISARNFPKAVELLERLTDGTR